MRFPTLALIGKPNSPVLAAPLRTLAEALAATGRSVLIETETAHACALGGFDVATLDDIGRLASLAIVLGGDGTMLAAARRLAPWNVPLAGINHGRVGFITDIPLPRAQSAIMQLLDGAFQTEERFLLAGTARRGDEVLFNAEALNDVVISRAGRGGMIEMRVEVDGQPMARMRADGIVISSPTGSTAYALSANGPILHPTLQGMVLVPVAPQTLSNRPIVLPDTSTIDIALVSTGRVEAGVSAHFDMQTWSQLAEGDRIIVRRAPHTIRLLHPVGYSYYETLRQKLHWNRMPSERIDERDV